MEIAYLNQDTAHQDGTETAESRTASLKIKRSPGIGWQKAEQWKKHPVVHLEDNLLPPSSSSLLVVKWRNKTLAHTLWTKHMMGLCIVGRQSFPVRCPTYGSSQWPHNPGRNSMKTVLLQPSLLLQRTHSRSTPWITADCWKTTLKDMARLLLARSLHLSAANIHRSGVNRAVWSHEGRNRGSVSSGPRGMQQGQSKANSI